MREIINPFIHAKEDDYYCFGCSPHNPHGLNLKFWEDGDAIVGEVEPERFLEGYKDILHGGIQATLHDEVAAWFVYAKCGTSGVTAALNVTYRKPAMMTKGTFRLRGTLKEQTRRIVTIHTELFNNDGELASEAEAKYFIYPTEVAIAKYHYPGKDAFFAKK